MQEISLMSRDRKGKIHIGRSHRVSANSSMERLQNETEIKNTKLKNKDDYNADIRTLEDQKS